jgi:hypothetical protein
MRRRSWVGVGGLGVAAAAVLVAPALHAGAATTVDAVTTPTTAHGTNFLLKTQLDTNYCVAVESGTAPGRPITLAPCNTSDEMQRWALTWNEDNTNLFVDTQGMCIEARLRTTNQGQTASVQRCRFGDAWRFTYTPLGQIQEVKNGRCLSVAGAAGSLPVVFAPCDENSKGQFWKFAR